MCKRKSDQSCDLGAILDFPKITLKALKIFFSKTNKQFHVELCLYLCQTNIFEVCESCFIPLPAMAAILHFAKSVKCFHIKIHISNPLILCILVMFMMYIKSWMSNSEWSRDLTAIFDFLSITCKPVSNNLFYRGNGIISHIIMCITNSRPPGNDTEMVIVGYGS